MLPLKYESIFDKYLSYTSRFFVLTFYAEVVQVTFSLYLRLSLIVFTDTLIPLWIIPL